MSMPPARRSLGAGHILLIIFGALAMLVALGTLAGGSVLLWADRTQRDGDGYLNTSIQHVDTTAYAVVARNLDVEVPGWMTGADRIGSVRVDVTPAQAGAEVFVGIGPRSSVDTYLAGVDRAEVTRWDQPDSTVQLNRIGGGAPAGAPGEQAFWAASRSGAGAQTLAWEVSGGSWEVVVMRADAAAGLSFDARAGATVPFILPVGIGLVVGGALIGLVGLLMVLLGARPGQPVPARYGYAPPPPGWAPPPPLPPGAAAYAVTPPPPPPGPGFTVFPVALSGHLEEPQSRWLWLVKWVLLIPHAIALAFLYVAFFLLTLAALVAILFTGRYPRSIFDFNLGVMRWTWRVVFYGYSALGTDRYPPFSLGEEPDYPARLDVAYPERLSRGLVLVKSWLLAIPHLIVVSLLVGGLGWRPYSIGVIGALVLVNGIILLVTERQNRQLFDLVMGLNRWAARVAAYVALMRDEYPPFRLDMGENEPDLAGTGTPVVPTVPRPVGT